MITGRRALLRRLARILYSLSGAVLITAIIFAVIPPEVTLAGSDTWTSPDGSVSFSFTTPDTYSSCSTSSFSDQIYTKGLPDTYSLKGRVTVDFVVDSGRIQYHQYDVNQNGDLNLTVSYPPVTTWPAHSNGTREIHVDISITVYDQNGQVATWAGNFPGNIGPGHQWDIYCLGLPQPSPTFTATSSPTFTATPTNTPEGPTPTFTNTPEGPTPTFTNTPEGPTPTFTNTPEGPTPTSTKKPPSQPTETNTPQPSATPTSGTPQPNLLDPKRVRLLEDNDGNGYASPGDVLEYQIAITNTGNGPASGVAFQDNIESNISLVPGSVSTTLGTILSGNTAGDTVVSVDIGMINPGDEAVVTFRVTVNPLPPGVCEIVNQSSLTGENFTRVMSDNVNTSAPNDATTINTCAPATPAPTPTSGTTPSAPQVSPSPTPGVLIPVTGADLSGGLLAGPKRLLFGLSLLLFGAAVLTQAASFEGRTERDGEDKPS